MDTTANDQVVSSVAARKVWEAPKVVLERSLFASAQGGPPGSQQGFLAPMTTSGGTGPSGEPGSC